MGGVLAQLDGRRRMLWCVDRTSVAEDLRCRTAPLQIGTLQSKHSRDVALVPWASSRHGVERPRIVSIRWMNSSTFARFTISVGTIICFDSGMNDRSPRTAWAMRVMAW